MCDQFAKTTNLLTTAEENHSSFFFPKNLTVAQKEKKKKKRKKEWYVYHANKEYSKNGKHTSSGQKIQEKKVGERDRVPCGGEGRKRITKES